MAPQDPQETPQTPRQTPRRVLENFDFFLKKINFSKNSWGASWGSGSPPGGLGGGQFGSKGLSIRGHDVFFRRPDGGSGQFGPVLASSGQVWTGKIESEARSGRGVWPVSLSIVELLESKTVVFEPKNG